MSVLTIPGKHDVDRSLIGNFTQLGHGAVRNATEDEVDRVLAEQVSDPNGESVLLEKLAAYREFAAQYESDFDSAAKPFWQRSFNVDGPYHLNLIGLNSVLVSGHDDERGKMLEFVKYSAYGTPRAALKPQRARSRLLTLEKLLPTN